VLSCTRHIKKTERDIARCDPESRANLDQRKFGASAAFTFSNIGLFDLKGSIRLWLYLEFRSIPEYSTCLNFRNNTTLVLSLGIGSLILIILIKVGSLEI
jgi:hypothetical protein